ncbi:MAG: pyridoxamine 5'-phosphate oxidase family protein [Thermodesulfobacteriota bacterium]|nr:pyridoxamine 5'-phosphate oxidase family protein [Thermodesulfobacteriota bacterium]
MASKLVDFFNKRPRIGTLSTADKEGKVNVAVFGSPQMEDESTIAMGLGNNRSFKNLQENPYAVYIVMEPGQSTGDWKGVRVYLKMKDCQTSGPKLENIKAMLGDAGKMMHAAITFEVIELRPIIDMGQGWEKSI